MPNIYACFLFSFWVAIFKLLDLQQESIGVSLQVHDLCWRPPDMHQVLLERQLFQSWTWMGHQDEEQVIDFIDFIINYLYFIFIGMEIVETDARERTLSVGENLSKRVIDKHMRINVHNVEMLKNRIKVLSSQADYNRFKTKYQTEKIERYNRIH